MKILCNREGLLAAFGMVSGVVPTRSPKPILQNVLLTAAFGGSTLSGTDLGVGIRYQVLGVKIDQPGSVVLPTQRLGSILRASHDDELAIDVEDGQITIRGLHSEWKLPTEDPDLFPSVPGFDAESYHVISAHDLKRMIRRTIFATDVDSTRYALGGLLVELTDDQVTFVGTDGRRLALMRAAVEAEGNPKTPATAPVIPIKAAKLIDRNLDPDDPPVHIAVDGNKAVLVRTDRAVIYTRLVEGRFPRYQDVFPAEPAATIPMEVGPLLLAVAQASIVTSEESRGVDFTFSKGVLRLESKAADVGSSVVDLPIPYHGPAVEITFDPRYLAEALKALEEHAVITACLIDHKSAALFRTDDQYQYIVMPLTRDR